MILRACCLILCGGLSAGIGESWGQEAPVAVEATEGLDRLSAYELTEASVRGISENADIFTDLSSITVELEPVKLPDDQSQD